MTSPLAPRASAARTLPLHLVRAWRAEATRTGGRGFLWSVAVPAAVLLPLFITFAIAAVAEAFAEIPGQISVLPTTTSNSVYWVMSFTAIIMCVASAYGFATSQRAPAAQVNHSVFPRQYVVALAAWCWYGVIAAILSFVLVMIILLTLPARFPIIYGTVDIASAEGVRFLWTVPLYAFIACGMGIGVAALLRSPAASVATVLLWFFIIENSITLIPNGYAIQTYMPFLNGVFSTGQQLGFNPPWTANGAAWYFAAVSGLVFLLGCVNTQVRRGR